MTPENQLVGGAMIVFGLMLAWAALTRPAWWVEMPKAKWLEERLGENGATTAVVLLGAGIAILGLAYLGGYLR